MVGAIMAVIGVVTCLIILGFFLNFHKEIRKDTK